MAPEDLTERLQALSLSEHLLFNPIGDKLWLRRQLDDIPRYLFRVYTPASDGTTDEVWVKSKAASHDTANSRTDIFPINDNEQVADMLNIHLRWKGNPLDGDNFVS